MSLDALKKEQEEVAKKIAEMDAAGQHGEELDKLKARHEELTKQIEEAPISEDLQ